jgi:hypothetical protein
MILVAWTAVLPPLLVQQNQPVVDEPLQVFATYFLRDKEDVQLAGKYMITEKTLKSLDSKHYEWAKLPGNKVILSYVSPNTLKIWQKRRQVFEAVAHLGSRRKAVSFDQLPKEYSETVRELFNIATGLEPEEGSQISAGLRLNSYNSVRGNWVALGTSSDFEAPDRKSFKGLDCKPASKERMTKLFEEYQGVFAVSRSMEICITPFQAGGTFTDTIDPLKKAFDYQLLRVKKLDVDATKIFENQAKQLYAKWIDGIDAESKKKYPTEISAAREANFKRRLRALGLSEDVTREEIFRATKSAQVNFGVSIFCLFQSEGQVETANIVPTFFQIEPKK